jgi:D-amino-acid dehydrogenase
MRELGYDLPDDVITGAELHELEPSLSEKVTAGFLVREHWHVKSDTFTAGLATVLGRMGVEIREGAEVLQLIHQGRRVTRVRTAVGDYEADTVVLAAGSWTTPLAASVGVSIPMEPGKGYSFTVHPTIMPSHAVLLVDVHVGCTPFNDGLRIGGTMEFSGINTHLDQRRINVIVAGARESFAPWQKPDIESEWTGMRPITVDGLPIVDRAQPFENTYLATGYGMQGMTLAPSAARGLTELITTGRRPELLEPFRLDRFGRMPLRRAARQLVPL